jgi:hypothetical protein
MNRISAATASALLLAFWSATFLSPDPREGAAPRRFEPRLRRMFENNAPGIRALAIPMNGLLYLFGEHRGSDAVFVATSRRHGRLLFLTSERELEQGQAGPSRVVIARNTDLVRARIASLREGGAARVILVPVPTKLSVFLAADPSVRAEVCGLEDAERCDGGRTAAAYERFVRSLGGEPEGRPVSGERDREVARAEGVDVVALQRSMAARAARDLLFAYEDTHWTSLGLSLAAAAVARVWQGEAAGPATPVHIGRLRDAPGDLQHLLAVPDRSFFRTHPAELDLFDLHESRPTAPCSGLSSASPTGDRPALLLGTSYSRPRGQRLAALLTQATGCAVTDLSVDGDGPVASFHALFADHAGDLRGAVVIWELPFRDLADPRAFVDH